MLSVACAVAPDIGALIAFRFLQGMAGAGGVVLSLAIVRDLYTGSALARALGSLMLVFGLAPVLAPVPQPQPQPQPHPANGEQLGPATATAPGATR